jgi:uncharacterized protein (DUF2147 family)
VRASGILVGLAILVALPSPAAAQQAPAAAAKAAPSLDTLVGRWVRSEGGYVVEIRSVAPDGKLQASYFNPRSIHVGKAEAVRKGSTIEVFIELRDVNYPGSTYTLTFDPKADRLVGRYYQAVARETFDVFFVRMKQ